MGYVKDGEKRYFIKAMTGLVLFFAAVWLKRTAMHQIANPALLMTVELLPLLPILFVGSAVWRFYQGSDELERQTILKMSAVGTFLSLIILIAWSILQPIGLPPLTAQTAILVMCGCIFISGLAVRFLELRTDWGMKQAFFRVIPMLGLLVCMVALVLVANHFLPVQSAPILRSLVVLGGAIVIMTGFRLLKRRVDP